MKLSQFCIKRPVFATVINLLIILMGIICYQKLTVREYPDITTPVISVSTVYPGASAEIVEQEITRIIEDAISGITGLDYMTSSSSDSSSYVSMIFKPNQNIDLAANDVRDKVSGIRGSLPKDIKEPIVAKADADAHPIIWLSLASDRYDLMDLSEIAQHVIKDQLDVIPGVASVEVVGERRPAMRIWIDPDRLSAFDLTVQEVVQAIRAQNIALPTGSISTDSMEFTLYAKTDLQSEKEFGDIILRENQGYLVTLGDVASVRIEPKTKKFVTRFNGQQTVAFGLVKQSTANPLSISKALNDIMPNLKASVPNGIKVDIAYDSTTIIKDSIHAVQKTLLEAIVLVVLIIFLFLRSFGATLIPIVTIPVSLIGGMAIIYLFGFSINLLTLLAMVLAIGLVVDDAIVVLENIFRHIENDEPPMKAAQIGIREIGSAVISMTLTLAAVFAPIAFMEGKFGKLFTEFAVVLAGCVFVSGFTALTLSPVMSASLLRKQTSHGALYNSIDRVINGITNYYQKSLHFFLAKRLWVLLGLVIILIANGFLFQGLKSELTPQEERGFALISGVAKEGATIGFTKKHGLKYEPIINSIPEIDDYFLIMGYPNARQAFVFAKMAKNTESGLSQFEVVDKLNQQLYWLPGLMSFAINPPSSLSDDFFDKGLNLVVQYPGQYDELKKFVDKIVEKAKTNPKLINLEANLKANKPQIDLSVNREKVALSGVNVNAISETLQILMGGKDITHFQRGAKQYDVVVKSKSDFRQTPEDVQKIQMRTKEGMAPLVNFVETKQVTVPSTLNRFNKLPSVTLTCGLAPDYTIDEAVAYFREIMQEEDNRALMDFTGNTRLYLKSTQGIYLTFLLALLVVFLVLSAQFESFIKPFVIMLSVPLAVFGSLVTMHLHGGSLNIYSQIGFITLIGLITKHGILIVEFTKQLVEQGVALQEAIQKAAVLRFRPILMTTLATICGCIPLAIATGAGSESRQEIGWVVVGGMALGTVFTLYVVPVILSLFSFKSASSS